MTSSNWAKRVRIAITGNAGARARIVAVKSSFEHKDSSNFAIKRARAPAFPLGCVRRARVYCDFRRVHRVCSLPTLSGEALMLLKVVCLRQAQVEVSTTRVSGWILEAPWGE
jgi:hypothetical protein